MLKKQEVPRVFFRLVVDEDCVCGGRKTVSGVPVRQGALPANAVLKILVPKGLVHSGFDVVAGVVVAVDVDRSSAFEHPSHFPQPSVQPHKVCW